MSVYLSIVQSKGAFMDRLGSLVEECEKENTSKAKAGLMLQRRFRGFVFRQTLGDWDVKVRFIQRIFRGHVGRNIVRTVLKAKAEFRLRALHLTRLISVT